MIIKEDEFICFTTDTLTLDVTKCCKIVSDCKAFISFKDSSFNNDKKWMMFKIRRLLKNEDK